MATIEQSLYARLCTEWLTCNLPLNSHSSTVRTLFLSSPFHQRANWGGQRLNNLHKLMQLEMVKPVYKLWSQTPKPMSLTVTLTLPHHPAVLSSIWAWCPCIVLTMNSSPLFNLGARPPICIWWVLTVSGLLREHTEERLGVESMLSRAEWVELGSASWKRKSWIDLVKDKRHRV